MAGSLGSPERTVLIALLLVDGEVTTPELKQRQGVELRKETREKLNRAGLISSRTEKVPHRHRITDEGVSRCEEMLAAGTRPPQATASLAVCYALLGPFASYFQFRGISLVDVLREKQIRGVYQELSVKPQDWVRLAKLRPELNGTDKKEIDRVLVEMTKTELVHLAPSSNRKALTEADHEAAVLIGNENKHLVAIEES